ncbi:hypothetical protein ACSBR1_040820 [Camellia fascicularis]
MDWCNMSQNEVSFRKSIQQREVMESKSSKCGRVRGSFVPVDNRESCSPNMLLFSMSGRHLNDLVKSYFHVFAYRSTYVTSIFLIPTVKQPPLDPYDYVVNPLAVKRPQAG